MKTGALYDLEELYKLNIIDIPKLFENASTPLIFSSLLSGDVNTVRFLMDKGFDINTLSASKKNAADYLFQNIDCTKFLEYSKMIHFLIENKISIHPAFGLIDFDYIDPSDKEEYVSILKCIFKDLLQFSEVYLPQEIVYLKDFPSANQTKLIELLLDAIFENTREFLNEIHTPNESSKKSEILHTIAFQLQRLGFDTSKLDHLLDQ